MGHSSTRTIVAAAVAAFVVYLAVYYWDDVSEFLGILLSSLAPLLLGLFIAYPLNILMSFYERHFFPSVTTGPLVRIRPAVCLAAAFISLVLIVAGVMALVIPQVIECISLLVSDLPSALDRFITWLQSTNLITDDLLKELSAALDSIEWRETAQNAATVAIKGVAGAVGNVVTGVASFVIGVVFAVFILMSKRRLCEQCNLLMDRYLSDRVSARLRYVASEANGCFHRFLVGQCTEACILGGLCCLGMLILRLPHAVMIGALTAVTALIPIIGAFLSGIVGAFLILMDSPIQALVFVIFIVVLQQVEGDLIYPHVVGPMVQLPSIWVFFAVTAGGGAFGIVGMFLGVPLVATVYRLLKNDVYGLTPPECFKEKDRA